ncbi:hypothetical protein [Nocardia transvalensis]|uniref:hypothetical protein n=1 Tax=Nocardia transvalensis TaxID=37333 RepID=UPI001895B285|nr:hypothetical protein [Nocardia transvalensis]MBF6330067.1 hypothetical protein [Nocardia transvalensis]
MTHKALAGLDGMVGEWRVESPQFPGAEGRSVIEWLDGAFLKISDHAPEPAPRGTWIIGGDETTEDIAVLYHDSRDVSRVYRMRVDGTSWRIERDAPGFFQRFSATLDGNTIRGTWEKSTDGASWDLDFDLLYHRIER